MVTPAVDSLAPAENGAGFVSSSYPRVRSRGDRFPAPAQLCRCHFPLTFSTPPALVCRNAGLHDRMRTGWGFLLWAFFVLSIEGGLDITGTYLQDGDIAGHAQGKKLAENCEGVGRGGSGGRTSETKRLEGTLVTHPTTPPAADEVEHPARDIIDHQPPPPPPPPPRFALPFLSSDIDPRLFLFVHPLQPSLRPPRISLTPPGIPSTPQTTNPPP